jgi:hypothetical protein
MTALATIVYVTGGAHVTRNRRGMSGMGMSTADGQGTLESWFYTSSKGGSSACLDPYIEQEDCEEQNGATWVGCGYCSDTGAGGVPFCAPSVGWKRARR